jgi:hypothetical protein
MTKRYSHLNLEIRKQAMLALEASFNSMEIGWVLEKERGFQDFHPEICRLTILAQW